MFAVSLEMTVVGGRSVWEWICCLERGFAGFPPQPAHEDPDGMHLTSTHFSPFPPPKNSFTTLPTTTSPVTFFAPPVDPS
ncbi:hypothetical protein L596_009181 [Steinernema carpocapsae]|uniref:Uncharacterized protein n=1 Tax=Steinernema carpocapsae TaxID=34508 RepID=A0A4V6A6H7_STECR|nr:hypothetical protein L596_009181 [Steinernema carpocapsae]